MPAANRERTASVRPAGQPGRRLVAALAVAWAMLVITAYYAVHKPAAPLQLAALGRVLLTLLGLLGTLALAQALGRPWAGLLPAMGARAAWAVELGLGLVTLSYLMLGLGALGAFHPALAWALVALSLPFGLRRLAAGLQAALPGLPSRTADRLLALLVMVLLALAALRALAPPIAWDSLVYHLTGPKLYLQAGAIHHDLDLPYLGFPQAGSMLFTWGMLLAGDRLAQWIHLTFAVLTLALVPEAVKRIAPGRGWLAAALLIGIPSAYLLAGVAYVEWLGMFAALGGLVVLNAAGSPPAGERAGTRAGWPAGTERRVLLVAGVLAGLALNAKYTNVWMVLGLALAIVLRSRSWRAAAIFAGTAAAACVPFLLKNLWLAGNPVYPFFLDGAFWDAHRAWWYSRPGTGLTAWQLLIAPWEATVWGVEGGVYLGHPSYGATVGPLLLALAPASLLGVKGAAADRRRDLTNLLAVLGCAYLGWIAQLGLSRLLVQTRLLFPVMPLLAILAAAGFEAVGELPGWGRSARFILGGLVAFSLLLTSVAIALDFAAQSPLAVVTGAQSEQDYLRAHLGQNALSMEALDDLPPGSRVRFLWEPRSYYCPDAIRCEPDALTDRWWHERQLGHAAADVAAAWRSQGVTHVLFYSLGAEAIRRAGFDPLTAADWEELEFFVNDFLAPVAEFGDAYALYSWR